MGNNTSKLDRRNQENNLGLANAPLKKKINFFSSIFIVIGAVIGAGIFFKSKTVLENSQGSILFSIFCWLLTVMAIIMMAMALIEISSARNDNLSLIGWCQTFNSRWVYKGCKNFMAFLYIPLTYFFLPLYFIQSMQSGIASIQGGTAHIGSENVSWIFTTLIVAAISVYFIVVCGISSRIGNIQNYIITVLNFIPVIIAIVMGIWGAASIGGIAGGQVGLNHGIVNNIKYDMINFIPSSTALPNELYTFQKMSPGFGLFIGAGAIFFAYDGFYVTAGIQSEMKEPKKTPYALLYGLLIITFIYLFVAISMSVGSTDGSPNGMHWFFKEKNVEWLYSVFQILIAIGVLSILNGFGLWGARFYENLIKANEIPFSSKYINKLNSHRPVVGIIYSLVISLPIIFVFCIIGALAYVNTGQYSVKELGEKLTRMYSFGDLIGTWCSVGAFTFIIFPVIGAIKNRQTENVRVEKNKAFIPCAILCIILMSLPIFVTYFAPIADLFMLNRIPANFDWAAHGINYNNDILIPRVMLVVVLILFIAMTFLPSYIKDKELIKKYGSIENGDGHNLEIIAKAKDISIQKMILEQLRISKRTRLNDWEKQKLNKDHLSKEEIEYIYKPKV